MTVSVSIVTVADDAGGVGFKLVGTNGSKYVNWVVLVTFCTLVDTL